MTGVIEIVSRLEEVGGVLELAGGRIRYRVPSGNPEIQCFLNELRKRRSEVMAFLRSRESTPQMPPGVRLISWNLKKPPVAIEYHAVIVDSAKFAGATLGELRQRILNPKRKYGWTVPQLIDRLAQVGVTVTLESTDKGSEANL